MAKNILNLTQHPGSAAQADVGVVEPADKAAVQAALTFTGLPQPGEVAARADALAAMAVGEGAEAAMIGGAPYLMGPLERALRAVGVTPLYAFSERRSEEVTEPDGSVVKKTLFVHLGFVEAVE